MSYELIRHKYGISTAYTWHLFGLYDNYQRVILKYLERIMGILEVVPGEFILMVSADPGVGIF
jgi:hypothetical protein